MRLRFGWMTLAVLLACPLAQAAWWGGGDKLPRPIDSPMLRPKVQEAHKFSGALKRHPAKLQDARWGRQTVIFKPVPKRVGHYMNQR